MLDYILIKGWKILNDFGYLSIPILVCFAQILGCPTEITMPMIFNEYKNIIAILLAGFSDFMAFSICFFAAKAISNRFNRKVLSRKEIALYRVIPLIRGGMIPLISFGYEWKEVLPIILITSFIWSILLYFASFFFDFWLLVDFVRRNERYLLILLLGILGYKGTRTLQRLFQRK